jgi:enoyl-CoA hydratase/carnithine racemase
VTLARDHLRNAVDATFAAAISDALRAARVAGARTAVLRSSGHVFSAGVDLSEPIRPNPGSPELVVAQVLRPPSR